jgi:hypothetical protein
MWKPEHTLTSATVYFSQSSGSSCLAEFEQNQAWTSRKMADVSDPEIAAGKSM